MSRKLFCIAALLLVAQAGAAFAQTPGVGIEFEPYIGAYVPFTDVVNDDIGGVKIPQALSIGDTLTATFTFKTPTAIGSARQSALRIGFFDTTGKPGLAADLTASSASPEPICNGLPGYMMDFDVKTGTEDIQFRKHDVTLTTGQLMANTTPDYINIASGGSVYSFAANTTYTGVLSLKRTGADTLSLTGSLRQGAALLSTYTGTDTNRIVSTFGMLAFHVTNGSIKTTSASARSFTRRSTLVTPQTQVPISLTRSCWVQRWPVELY